MGIWQVARHCKPMRTSAITSPMRLAWSSSHSGAHGPSALFAKWVILWVKLKAWTLAGSHCRTYDHLWPTSCLGSFMNQAFDHDDAPNPTQPKSFARVERWNSTLCTCIQRHQRSRCDVNHWMFIPILLASRPCVPHGCCFNRSWIWSSGWLNEPCMV